MFLIVGIVVYKNYAIKKTDEVDDPESMHLMCLVLFLSFNLMFNNETISSFKTYFIRRTRASVSGMMCELGNKSKNYCRMRAASFWKLHKLLKDEIDKKPHTTSHRSRKTKTKSHTQWHNVFFYLIERCFAHFCGGLSNGHCFSSWRFKTRVSFQRMESSRCSAQCPVPYH